MNHLVLRKVPCLWPRVSWAVRYAHDKFGVIFSWKRHNFQISSLTRDEDYLVKSRLFRSGDSVLVRVYNDGDPVAGW